MKRFGWALGCACALALVAAMPAAADSPGGAIFTTLPDGSEVNYNIYAAKEDVYLDGGPGIGAPQDAAGLDDGTYVFQITDPSGKTLLSQDAGRCRQFDVLDGIIVGVVAQPDGCEHLTGLDVDHGAVTVQMMPYADTPNNGGEYKAWATKLGDYIAGCAALGKTINDIDCGKSAGNFHGFIPSLSKTDNYKVRVGNNLEIDTVFVDSRTGAKLLGFGVTWFDTLGAQNKKFSYWDSDQNRYRRAHIEAVEKGTHKVIIANQPGCRVVNVNCYTLGCDHHVNGPTTVPVTIRQNDPIWTKEIVVTCDTAP